MTFGYGKLKTKIKKKGIPPRRNMDVKKYEQPGNTDTKEETRIVAQI